MSSVIELYEHNQKAYDALLDMLGERDRACIIKPTGTGKFVIIAKMVQDNPDKRFLLLGTNDYMFNDQMANLAEIAPGFTPENLQFMTYAAAMGMERRNDCVPPYDVIIADEFHHCGAEEWGKGVTHILNANESAKMDRKIRYFVNGWSFRLSFATRPGYDGDHEDISDGDSYELGEYENSEEALAAAEAFISTHGNEVNDEEDGIGSVIYWTVEVERRVEYKENEWLPCDESGRIDDGYGNEPNATVAYLSSLEGSREERAFELAKNEYLAWLEHKADRYTTVYGYMGLGDRYEQHLL